MKTPTKTANVTTVIAACLTLANIALAQSVPTPPVKAVKSDTIVLTPFEVASDQDNGYAATETLRAWGVPVDAVAPPAPSAFPASPGFAQAPAGWQR